MMDWLLGVAAGFAAFVVFVFIRGATSPAPARRRWPSSPPIVLFESRPTERKRESDDAN